MDELPVKTVTVTVLGCDEIGYQRKGLTGEWYNKYDEGYFKYFETDKAKLEEILEHYCEDYAKENFKEQIVDRFVPGEMFVGFDW